MFLIFDLLFGAVVDLCSVVGLYFGVFAFIWGFLTRLIVERGKYQKIWRFLFEDWGKID